VPKQRKGDRDKRGKGRKDGGGKGRGGKKKKGKKGGGEDWFTKTLSKKGLRREVSAAAKLEFRPQERQIEAEQRASERRQKEIPAWFKGYLDTVTGSRAATQAAYGAVGAEQGARTQKALAQDEALREKLVAEERADAAKRGVAYDPEAGESLAQASLARRNLSDAAQNLVGTQGASQYAYLTDQARIGKGEQLNQVLREQARARTLDVDLREFAQRKGEYKAAKRGELRGEEREYGLARQEFGSEKAGRRTQKKVAKQYGKNKKREQKRSLSNQLSVIGAQSQAAKAKQRGSTRSQLKVQQGYGKGGGKGKGGVSKGQVKTGRGYLGQASKKDIRRAGGKVNYLMGRGGFSIKEARRAAGRGGGKKKRRRAPLSGGGYQY